MYCKEISYEDFDGNQVSEKLYFNLTKAELAQLEMTTPGGMQAHIQSIIDSNNATDLVALFKDLILMSYGKKSDDGRKHIKTEAIKEDFLYSNAYSEFFMILASSTEEQIAFVNGIMPNDLINEAKKQGLLDENGSIVESKIEELKA